MKIISTNLVLSLIFIGLCFFNTDTIAASILEESSTTATQESVHPPVDKKKTKKRKWRKQKESPRKAKQQISAGQGFENTFWGTLIAAVVVFLISMMVAATGTWDAVVAALILAFIAVFILLPIALVSGIGWLISAENARH